MGQPNPTVRTQVNMVKILAAVLLTVLLIGVISVINITSYSKSILNLFLVFFLRQVDPSIALPQSEMPVNFGAAGAGHGPGGMPGKMPGMPGGQQGGGGGDNAGGGGGNNRQ